MTVPLSAISCWLASADVMRQYTIHMTATAYAIRSTLLPKIKAELRLQKRVLVRKKAPDSLERRCNSKGSD